MVMICSQVSTGGYCGGWLGRHGSPAWLAGRHQIGAGDKFVPASTHQLHPALGKCKSGSRYENNRFWQSGSGAPWSWWCGDLNLAPLTCPHTPLWRWAGLRFVCQAWSNQPTTPPTTPPTQKETKKKSTTIFSYIGPASFIGGAGEKFAG